MGDVRVKVKGVDSKGAIRNLDGVEINAVFNDDNVQPNITTTDFEFVNEMATLLIEHMEEKSIYESPAINLEASGYEAFEGVVKLTEHERTENYQIKAPLQAKEKLDWLNDKADGVTYSGLLARGIITEADERDIPYIINTIPDYLTTFTTLLTIFVLKNELKNAIDSVKNISSDLAGVTNMFSAVVMAVTRVGTLILLLYSIIRLIEQMFASIIQPVKYHKGITLETMLQKGAQALRLTFSSSAMNATYRRMAYMPSKREKGKKWINLANSTERGIPNESDAIYTFGDAIRLYKELINGKIFMDNGVLHIESLSNTAFWEKQSSYILEDVYRPVSSTNASEIVSNYLFEFMTDSMDMNTLADGRIDKASKQGQDTEDGDSSISISESTGDSLYTGTIYQVTTELANLSENIKAQITGLERISPQVALGTRKEELTLPEQLYSLLIEIINAIVYILATVVNILIGLVNGIISVINTIWDILDFLGIVDGDAPLVGYVSPVPSSITGLSIENSRIGVLNLSNDFTDVPKLLLLDDDGKISANHRDIVSAKGFWNAFHSDRTFVNVKNQYQTFKDIKIPRFNLDVFQELIKSNMFKTAQGQSGKFTKVLWSPVNDYATCDFRIQKTFATNLVHRYSEPD